MKTLHPDLEALMPEPAYRITSKMGEFICLRSKNYDNKKGDTLFTADQVRAAILGATQKERKEIQAALRHAGLMLVRTEHGLCVMKTITDAEAEAAATEGTK